MITIGKTIYKSLKNIGDNNYASNWLVEASTGEILFLRVPQEEYPSAEGLAAIRYEFDILSNMNFKQNLNALKMEGYKNSYIIFMEPFDGIQLSGTNIFKKSIQNGGLKSEQDIYKACIIFLNTAKLLSELHKKELIHNNINPTSILVNEETGDVKLKDFLNATKFSLDLISKINLNISDENYYISPEQTGRMNKFIDYRTDLYSLGAVFYHLITGEKPFLTGDLLKTLHSIIAVMPINPIKLNDKTPKFISDMLGKLLEKMPENRYQSAEGLIADLDESLEIIKNSQFTNDFYVGKNDMKSILTLPDKYYKRGNEDLELKKAYDNCIKGIPGLLFIEGEAGMGKTTLVEKILRPEVLGNGGFFISGGYEEKHIGNSTNGIMKAFSDFSEQLFIRYAVKNEELKQKIINVTSPNTEILTQFIPGIEKNIGSQKPVSEVDPTESKNRFYKTIGDFLQLFTTNEHPVVIFLENLQWSDITTCELIKYLFRSKTLEHFLVVCSYNKNKLKKGQPFYELLQYTDLTSNYCEIKLSEFDLDTTNTFVSDTLSVNHLETTELSGIIYRTSRGNPLLINELLKKIITEKLLNFDIDKKTWSWDIEKIKLNEQVENIESFISNGLKRLSEKSLNFLLAASCIGETFNLMQVYYLMDSDMDNILLMLEEVVLAGFILPMNSSYKLLRFMRNAEVDLQCKFQHIRIQQFAYFYLNELTRKKYHIKIGRELLKSKIEKKSFTNDEAIVSHFNEALDLIDDLSEKLEIARLNLSIVKKMVASTNYRNAFKYISSARALLPDDFWTEDYNLTMDIYKKYAECAFLCSKIEQAEDAVELLMSKAKTNLEKAEIRLTQLANYTFLIKMEEAINVGIIGLMHLGIKIKSKPGMQEVLTELLKVKSLLINKSISKLENRPDIIDEKVKVSMKLLLRFIAPSYLSGNANLFAVIVLKLVGLALKHGNSMESAAAYAGYAVLLSGLGDLKGAHEFGKLSLKLSEKIDSPEWKGMIYVFYGLFSYSWNEDWKDMSKWYRLSVEDALKTGDFMYTSFACTYINLWDRGVDLNKALKEFNNYIKIIQSTIYKNPLNQALISRQRWMCLQGKTENRTSFNSSKEINEKDELYFSEDKVLKEIKDADYVSGLAIYYTFKMEIAYIFESYELAFNYMLEADKNISALAGSPFVVEHCMFSFLISAGMIKLKNKKSQVHIQRMNKEFTKMSKWAKNCSINFEHKRLLMQAIISTLNNDGQEIILVLGKVIKLSTENEDMLICAITKELTAEYFLKNKMDSIAENFYKDASAEYKKFGATEKSKQIDEKFFNLKENIGIAPRTIDDFETDIIDITSIIKTYQTLSKEIIFSELLKKLMDVVLESAGAQKAMLFLKKNNKWFLEAEAANDFVNVLQNLQLESVNVPKEILFKCIKTETAVLIDDAKNHSDFSSTSNDIMEGHKSVLCLPLTNQGAVIGILYLENKLLTGAFTKKQLKVLELLSAQIAISIENANLYTNLKSYREKLEEMVEERTYDLKIAYENLKATQHQLAESEKMAALGQLVAGIAHEINTPLGAISASISNIENYLDGSFEKKIPYLVRVLKEEDLSLLFEMIDDANRNNVFLSSREEREYRRILVKELTELSINEPDEIARILVDIGILKGSSKYKSLLINSDKESILKSAYELTGIKRNSSNISLAVEKASKIVFALKNYTHFDNSGTLIESDIIAGIETVLTIFHNKIKHGVGIIRDYTGVIKIKCFPDELNQVWTNIISNSLQSMDYKGVLKISAHRENEKVIVKITDTGKGIPKEISEKIFDPFFTTKAQGEGTGLGLGIVKNILNKHDATIDFYSEPGKTEFVISIPANL